MSKNAFLNGHTSPCKGRYKLIISTLFGLHIALDIIGGEILKGVIFVIALVFSVGLFAQGSHCHRFYASESLTVFKSKILEIAKNDKFLANKIRLNSSGKDIEFMYPLVVHSLEKADRLMQESPFPEMVNEFHQKKNNWLQQLKNGTLTYEQILDLTETVSLYIENRYEGFFKTNIALEMGAASLHDTYVDFINQGVYLLPMFFTPDFKLRTQLVALNVFPVSIAQNKFFSVLDQMSYSVDAGVYHDLAHALVFIETVRGKVGKKLLVKVRQKMIENVETFKGVQKDIAYFLLHQMLPEGNLEFSSKKAILDSIDRSVASALRDYFFSPSRQDWILKALGFANNRIEVSPGHYFHYQPKTKSQKGKFIEGNPKDFEIFISHLSKQFISNMREIIKKDYQ